ncbi:uncharacterized protein LOC134012070 [Osmerus eperlanus]|uniref:uncharacterized protein LOC134012070 n=1 Tax=Osmerus eperlanus TaxID=29151 RepID=UPI002E11AB33
MTIFGVVCAIAVTSSKPVSLYGSQWTAMMTGNIVTSSSESNESNSSSEETEGGTPLPLTTLPPIRDEALPPIRDETCSPDGQEELDSSDREGELPSSNEVSQTTFDSDPSVLPDSDASQTSTDIGESNEPPQTSVGTDEPQTFDGDGSLLPTLSPLPETNVLQDPALTDAQFPLILDGIAVTVLSTISSTKHQGLPVDLTPPPAPVILKPRPLPVSAVPFQPLPAGPTEAPTEAPSCFIVDITTPVPGPARGDSI